jgi:CheY-like chemotaxis protein
MEPVDIDELMRDVVELTRTRWRDDAMSRGIKYEISLNFGEGSIVIGSPSELREVFTNIVINALDAMPDGGRLSLRSHIEGERARLTFSDTGIGMTEDVISRIFEPFFSTKGHAGTGLGLAVSYGIIERHSGTIEVSSTPGAGTTFNIFLPLTTAGVAPAHVPQPQIRLSKVRILVVDDEEMVRQTLVDILDSLGYEVVGAEGGSAGLKHLNERAADIVMTDLSMPEMDGWTFARHIKAGHPDTPVVLVTGYGASIDLNGERAGLIDEVICKPYDFNEIAQIVERLAGKGPLELIG